MSEFRNPSDPMERDTPYDPNVRGKNAAWGWVAGAVFVVVVLAIVFGAGHAPNPAGSNTVANNAPPPSSQIAPAPNGPASPGYTPAPMTPPANPAPARP